MSKILLVSNEKAQAALVALIGECGGAGVQINAENSADRAKTLVNEYDYDLIIVNTPLSDEFGSDFAVQISLSTNAGIIVVAKEEIRSETAEYLKPFGVPVVSNPISKAAFSQTFGVVAVTRFRTLKLREENRKLLTKVEEIRIVNRAKSALMQYLNFTEPQAHRYIEKQAMDNRRSKYEVAQNILKTYEM